MRVVRAQLCWSLVASSTRRSLPICSIHTLVLVDTLVQ
jgi:hypothetical protein